MATTAISRPEITSHATSPPLHQSPSGPVGKRYGTALSQGNHRLSSNGHQPMSAGSGGGGNTTAARDEYQPASSSFQTTLEPHHHGLTREEEEDPDEDGECEDDEEETEPYLPASKRPRLSPNTTRSHGTPPVPTANASPTPHTPSHPIFKTYITHGVQSSAPTPAEFVGRAIWNKLDTVRAALLCPTCPGSLSLSPLSLYLSLSLSFSLYLSLPLSASLYLSLPLSTSLYLSLPLSTSISISISISLSISLPLYLYPPPSLYLSFSLSRFSRSALSPFLLTV